MQGLKVQTVPIGVLVERFKQINLIGLPYAYCNQRNKHFFDRLMMDRDLPFGPRLSLSCGHFFPTSAPRLLQRNSDDDLPQEMKTGAHSAPLITLAAFAGMFLVQTCKEFEEYGCKND